MDKNIYFNDIFCKLTAKTPQKITCNIPDILGEGEITQIVTKQGCILSDWSMKYLKKTDLTGINSDEYFQVIFCMGEGVSWEINNNYRSIDCNESCMYRGNGRTENISYDKNCDYHFKSIKIPNNYFMNILDEYFTSCEKIMIEKKITCSKSGKRTTNVMQRILSDMLEYFDCYGSVGFLYLDSKILQLLSEYIKELLCVDLCEKDMNISKDDIKAIFSIKNMIDTKISFVPSCSDMAKITGMSMSKFKKCFTQIVGMPFYTMLLIKDLNKQQS